MNYDFFIKTGDRKQSITTRLTDVDDDPVDLSAATVKLHVYTLDEDEVVNAEADVVDAEAGRVRYDWQESDTDTVGLLLAEWEVTHSSGEKETYPNAGYDHIKVTESLA